MTARPAHLLSLLLITTLGCGRHLRAPPPPANFEGTYHRFPTGLQLAVYEDPTATRVTVSVSFGAGALDDPRGQEGLAHLVEHLTARGRAAGGDSSSIDARMFALGADDNALTTHEETRYYAQVAAQRVPQLLALEAERMRAPMSGLTEAEFQAERGVVETELHERLYDDTLMARVTLAMQLSFEGHEYGRPVAGSETSLRRIQLSDAQRWARSLYTPDNAVIVISGPVTPASAREWVEQAFGGMVSGQGYPLNPPASRLPPPMPAKLTRPKALSIALAPVPTRELWLIWPAPGRASGEETRIYAACAALESVLNRMVWFDPRVRSVEVRPVVLEGITVVMAQLALHSGADALQVRTEVLAKLEIPTWKANSGDHADRVANALATQSFLALEGDIADPATQHVRSNRRSDFAAAWRANILQGVDGSMFEAAHAYFPKDQVRSLLLVPHAMGTASQGPPPLLSSGETGGLSRAPPPPGEDDPRAIMSVPPREQQFTLSNGLKVLAIRHQRLPRIHARLVLRSRPSGLLSAKELPVLASLQTGGYYRPWAISGMAHDGHLVQQWTVAPDELPDVAVWMAQWVRDIEVDSSTHQRLTRWVAEVLEKVGDQPSLRLLGFEQEHLLGRPREDAKVIAQRIRELPVESVEKWLHHELRPQNATLIVVGALPPIDELRDMLEWKFLGWGNTRGAGEILGFVEPPPSSVGTAWPQAAPRPKGPRALLHPEKSSLTRVTVTVRGEAIDLRTMANWNVLSDLVEGRLTTELRGRRGIAYDVSASVQDHRNATLLSVTTRVRAEHAAEVVAHIRQVLQQLSSQPPTDEEVRSARWESARHFDDGFVTLAGIGERLQASVIRDASPELWREYPGQLAAVTAESVGAVARTLGVGAEAIILVGNLQGLEEALKSSGIPVETLPAESR